MAENVIRALAHRKPAPKFELATGRVVQTRYLDAVGHKVRRALLADPSNVELFFELVLLVVPELTREEIEDEASLQDCETILRIGRGHIDEAQEELKNTSSGGESPEPSLTPPSSPTT